MDRPPLNLGAIPLPLRTVNVMVGARGSVWSHCEVADLPPLSG